MGKLNRYFRKYENRGIQVSLLTLPSTEVLQVSYKGRLMRANPEELHLVINEANSTESTFKLEKSEECFTISISPDILKTNPQFYFKDNYQRIDNNLNAFYVINEKDAFKNRGDKAKNQLQDLKKYKHRGIYLSIITPKADELLELRYSGALINSDPAEIFLYTGPECETAFSKYQMPKDAGSFKTQIRAEEIRYNLFYFTDNKGAIDDNGEKYYRFSKKRPMESIIGNKSFDTALDQFIGELGSIKIDDDKTY